MAHIKYGPVSATREASFRDTQWRKGNTKARGIIRPAKTESKIRKVEIKIDSRVRKTTSILSERRVFMK
ncbi:hypothetical protein PYCH_12670 [Pyrococcus yayanosii CH1]|uniref:Uncharacterized protein n=2 Tax=Pyrococcus TaxID=2260 RepID=F8AFA9_PYRYC|nr:hypothetical protein PYCH_12670 [Pyrococcus yayanosii CH1]